MKNIAVSTIMKICFGEYHIQQFNCENFTSVFTCLAWSDRIAQLMKHFSLLAHPHVSDGPKGARLMIYGDGSCPSRADTPYVFKAAPREKAHTESLTVIAQPLASSINGPKESSGIRYRWQSGGKDSGRKGHWRIVRRHCGVALTATRKSRQ